MTGFPQTILDLFGTRGQAWLDNLPVLIAQLELRWEISVLPPFDNLSYNYVAPALRKDGTPVVLKLGVPNAILETELAALTCYAGRGVVRLVAAEGSAAALLLEHLQPGTLLAHMADDEEATHIAAQVMEAIRLPIEAPHPFPTIETIANGLARLRTTFEGGCGPFPENLVTRAERQFADLLASQGQPVLLHGDLHHWNILKSSDGWRAIDPQGFVGEAEYEIGALMRNMIPPASDMNSLVKRQDRRLAILSELLGYDRQRLAGWSFAQEVLSAWWEYEDHGTLDPKWLKTASSLEALL